MRTALAILCWLLPALPANAATWLTLRTTHCLLLGDASARDLKDVALRFEQFRRAVTTVFPVLADDRPGAPIVVIVFRDHRSYEPFEPRFNGKTVEVGGYYLPGKDVNYITLAADSKGAAYQTVYHEFTHLLIRRLAGNLAPWFNEGLAEYFSTFEAAGGRARFGQPVQSHVGLLRERQMPLAELFGVTPQSSTYNEGQRRSLFYAESWLLIHYAFIENPDRWKQLVQFHTAVQTAGDVATTFQTVFGFAPETLERELDGYIRRPAMRYQAVALDERALTRIGTEPASIPDAEAQAWLGDLLAHAGRTEEATAQLEKVLATSPDLPLAHASLGILLLRQNKTDEARAHLERAASVDSTNEFVHYYGASLVERASSGAEGKGELPRAIAALERAIRLRPGFTDAEKMLGYGYLLGDRVEEGRDMLRRALADDPSDENVTLLLAQAEMRLGRVNEARFLLGPIVGRARDPRIREQARDLLARSVALEQRQQILSDSQIPTPDSEVPGSQSEVGNLESPGRAGPPGLVGPAGGMGPVGPVGPTIRPDLRAIQPGETRTYGVPGP